MRKLLRYLQLQEKTQEIKRALPESKEISNIIESKERFIYLPLEKEKVKVKKELFSEDKNENKNNINK